MKLILILLTLVLSSCSQLTVDYHVPTTGGYLPEASGAIFSGNIGGYLTSTQKVVVGSAQSVRIFGSSADTTINASPKGGSSAVLGLGGRFGLTNFLELGLRKSGESTTVLNATLQFLGGSTKERTVGYKASFSSGIGRGSQEESNFKLNDTTTNSTQDNLAGELDLKSVDFGLQHGFRFNKYLMLYNSFFYTEFEMEGSITATDGIKYNLVNTTTLKSVNLGILFTTSGLRAFQLQGEIGYSTSSVRGDARGSRDQATLLVSPSFRF